MPESKVSDNSRLTGGNRKRWWLRVILIIVVAISVWICYFWLSLPAPVLISPETTWITEPLTPNGTFVNFSQAFNDTFPATRGVWEQSPWFLLTHNDVSGSKTDFYRDPVDIIKKEHLKAVHEYVMRRSDAPFSEADDPELAAIIDANEQWYTVARATDPGSPLLPSSDEGFYLLFVNGGPHGPMIRRFALQTMLAFGSGDEEKGLQGLEFQAEVCRHARQVPGMLGSHHANALESQLCQQIWAIAMTQPNIDKKRMLDIIATLPVPETLVAEMVERFDRFERLIALNEIQKLQRGQVSILCDRFFPRDPEAPLIVSVRFGSLWRRIDYSALMRQQNVSIETVKTIQKSGSFEEQKLKLDEFSKSINRPQSSINPSELMFAVAGATLIHVAATVPLMQRVQMFSTVEVERVVGVVHAPRRRRTGFVAKVILPIRCREPLCLFPIISPKDLNPVPRMSCCSIYTLPEDLREKSG